MSTSVVDAALVSAAGARLSISGQAKAAAPTTAIALPRRKMKSRRVSPPWP
jgi:hypothetical protein